MLAYYCLLIIPILFNWRIKNYPRLVITKRNNSTTITAFFLILFLLLIFRSIDVGIDLNAYDYIYNKIASLEWNRIHLYNLEFGYILLNKIISVFPNGFRILIVACALITLIPIYKLYKEDIAYAPLKILLLVNISIFPMFFSGLRQAIAFAIGIIAYKYVREKNLVKFLLIVVLAFSFHHSAFILCALYPVYHMTLKKKHLIFIVPVMIAIFVFNRPIFNFLSLLISDLYSGIDVTPTGAFTMIVLFVMFSIFSYVIPDENKMDKETIGLRNIMLLATCIQFFAPLAGLAMRMNYYFIILIPVIIPKIIKLAKPEMKQVAKLANVCMCIFFFAYFFVNAYIGADILRLYPYIPFWRG